MSARIGVFLPMPLTGSGVSYTCGALAEGMANEELAVTIVTPRALARLVPSVELIQTLPKWTRFFPYRWVRNSAGRQIESAYLSQMARLRSQTIAAYIWPDASVETIRQLRRSGIPVFREMINCHRGTAKIILDQAYERLGAAPQHGISCASVQAEREALDSVNYIFCPSPMVESSLLENGVPAGKLLRASYGWALTRLAGSSSLLPPRHGMTAVFVGAICVRKGVQLLLKYWAQSGVKGRLVLAGDVEPIIKVKCAEFLDRDDVVVLDYFKDIGSLYRSADIFILPSFEEGSPLVIYEACGCRLPVITTPMGAGGIVRHNREGFVIDPNDSDAWIAAIRALAEDVELRRTMGNSAAERAQSFLWRSVAARRREQILACIASR
jgi:glycosyltransferase involved in cell wall biosynthesis